MLSSRKKEGAGKTEAWAKKGIIYYGVPLVGVLLCLWYVKEATCDIVYTDYIRLVNTYLPDVWNPEKFFVPDVLTRIPLSYVGRIINVTFFGYSTTFDMVLGVLGLGLSGLVLGSYCQEQKSGIGWFLFLMFLLFGLNKWEMLTNGSGWPHFVAFAGFYYHFVVFDRVLSGREKPHDRIRIVALPVVLILGVAGQYCAVYSVVVFLACGAAWLQCRQREKGDKRLWMAVFAGTAISFLLYLWSNSYGVEDHAGAVNISLIELLVTAPGFFPRFLLKSLASMLVGGETIIGWLEQGRISDNMVYGMGSLVAAAYVLALWLNFRFRLYQRTLLPLMLIFSGMGNHGIVLISRFIFLNENYGMSSRYVLQYQAGLLGIFLTIALLWRMEEKERKELCFCSLSLFLCLVFLAGHGYTDYVEAKKAPDREAYGRRIEAVAVQFENVDDEVLRSHFDYRPSREDSGAKVRNALTILKEQGWNVFRRQ